jgi:hypothetical protein
MSCTSYCTRTNECMGTASQSRRLSLSGTTFTINFLNNKLTFCYVTTRISELS